MRTPLDELAQQIAAGNMKVPIGRIFFMDQIVEAHRLMEENKAGGKIVVVVEGEPEAALLLYNMNVWMMENF